MMVKVRFGSGHVERPLGGLVLEALAAPAFLWLLWRQLRAGWGH